MIPGLYDENGILKYSWDKLLENGVINVESGVFSTNYIPEDIFVDEQKIKVINSMTNAELTEFANFCELYGRTNGFQTEDDILNFNFSDINLSCTVLKGSLIFPKDEFIICLAENAFCALEHLTKVKLSETIEKIGCACFASSGIKSLEIPPLVKEIKRSTFYNVNMTVLSLPSGLETVHRRAAFDSTIECILFKGKIYKNFEEFLSNNKKGMSIDELIAQNKTFKDINKELKTHGRIEIEDEDAEPLH